VQKHYILFSILAITSLFYSCDFQHEQVKTKSSEGTEEEVYSIDKDSKLKDGQYKKYYPSGKLAVEATYKNDTIVGLRTFYYENGKPQITESHDDHGNFSGDYFTYYENGNKELIGKYEDNMMTGQWKRYYDTGELMEVVMFKENAENGPFVEYYKNGKLKAEGNYLLGNHEHGELKLYNEDGLLEKKMECKHGICRTIWTKDKGNLPDDPNYFKDLDLVLHPQHDSDE